MNNSTFIIQLVSARTSPLFHLQVPQLFVPFYELGKPCSGKILEDKAASTIKRIQYLKKLNNNSSKTMVELCTLQL